MATSTAAIQAKINELRHDILSYKPGYEVPCTDERVVFPNKLVIGLFGTDLYLPFIVPGLRRALHVDGDFMDHQPDGAAYQDQEIPITDFISIVPKEITLAGPDKKCMDKLAEKIRCFVLIEHASDDFLSRCASAWIATIQEITGRPPICAIVSDSVRNDIERMKEFLVSVGFADIYEIPNPYRPVGTYISNKEELGLLEMLHKCLHHGDEQYPVQFNRTLSEMCENPHYKQIYQQALEVTERLRQRNEIEHKKHEDGMKILQKKILELQMRLGECPRSPERLSHVGLKSDMICLQENKEDTQTAMTEKGRPIGEIHKTSKKQCTETLGMMVNGISARQRVVQPMRIEQEEGNTRHDVQHALNTIKELPHDSFDGILKQIAEDLSDNDKIQSLGNLLGVREGVIDRAIQTNMRFHRITSDGTHHMLQEWRRSVSREDERVKLKRALVRANLLKLADRYFEKGKENGYIAEENFPENTDTHREYFRDDSKMDTSLHDQDLSCSSDKPVDTRVSVKATPTSYYNPVYDLISTDHEPLSFKSPDDDGYVTLPSWQQMNKEKTE